ncbi:hypothetical protein OsI_21461 [Oryza sativa Indica Group]|nr:hypothetical protein OsI_21461 [Oryza sativa Indica Group]EEE65017.1 hypothetical protein OsJ_19969 [Oryza sativa Japonica Group]BAD44780.1 hypothetical protein [Oryza sativa Japonica Group]BAD67930.1 hypothetical protein [Oryza sativa Japonica Group]
MVRECGRINQPVSVEVEHVHAIHGSNDHDLELDHIQEKERGMKKGPMRIPRFGGSRDEGDVASATIIFLFFSLFSQASSSSIAHAFLPAPTRQSGLVLASDIFPNGCRLSPSTDVPILVLASVVFPKGCRAER